MHTQHRLRLCTHFTTSQSDAYKPLHKSTNTACQEHNLLEAHTPLQSLSWPAHPSRCIHNLSHALHAHLKQLCAVHTPDPNFSAAHAHSHELSWHTHPRSLPPLQAHPTPTHPPGPVHPSPTPVWAHTETSSDTGCTHAPVAAACAPPHLFRPRRATGPLLPWGWSPG